MNKMLKLAFLIIIVFLFFRFLYTINEKSLNTNYNTEEVELPLKEKVATKLNTDNGWLLDKFII